jgi:phage antirepressor YoqD-like protein
MDLVPNNQRTMTIKDVAIAFNCDISTVTKRVKELFPDLSKNGIQTVLNEIQVTQLKLVLQQNSHLGNVSELPKTDLEKELLIAQAMQFQQEKIQTLQSRLSEAEEKIFLDAPKVESFEILMKTNTDMSITTACKHFSIHPKTDGFPYLREHGYLTQKDLPTQKAIDLGIMSVRENASRLAGTTFTQAVVKACQLEKFGKVISRAVQK